MDNRQRGSSRGSRRIRQYSQVFTGSVGFDRNDIRQKDSSENPKVEISETEGEARTISDGKQQEHSATSVVGAGRDIEYPSRLLQSDNLNGL